MILNRFYYRSQAIHILSLTAVAEKKYLGNGQESQEEG